MKSLIVKFWNTKPQKKKQNRKSFLLKQDEKIDLQSLIRKWYALLAAEGFDDIERDPTRAKKHCVEFKKSHSLYFSTKFTPLEFDIKKEHYRKAGLFLHEHCFENTEQKEIWRLYSEGITYREITSRLRNQFRTLNKDRAQKIIRSLRDTMREFYGND